MGWWQVGSILNKPEVLILDKPTILTFGSKNSTKAVYYAKIGNSSNVFIVNGASGAKQMMNLSR